MSEGAMIIRNKGDKTAKLYVRNAGAWGLFAANGRSCTLPVLPVLSGTGEGVFPLPSGAPGAREHAVFLFKSQQESRFLAERLLPMAGGFNLRDIGGFPVGKNRRVAWGRLFRADDLSTLTPEDLQYLSSIPISRVADFRTEREAARHPDKLPPSVREYLPMTIMPGSVRAEHVTASPEKAEAVMEETYRIFVKDPAITAVFRDFFRHVQTPGKGPLLYHCAAGKDRTGFATAVILLSLGVEVEAIMCDYLDSALYLKGKYQSLEGVFSVRKRFLNAALEEMRNACGSESAFLRDVLDIDCDRMRSLYLC